MLVSPEKRTRIFRMGKDEDMHVQHITQDFRKDTTAFLGGLGRMFIASVSTAADKESAHQPTCG